MSAEKIIKPSYVTRMNWKEEDLFFHFGWSEFELNLNDKKESVIRNFSG